MPISSFPQEQSLFERLGTGFGGGLSEQLSGSLQLLSKAKLNQMLQQHQRQQSQQFWEGLGLPQQTAQAFASAPEAVQKSILDRLEGLQIGGGVPAGFQAQQQPQVSQIAQMPFQAQPQLDKTPFEQQLNQALATLQEQGLSALPQQAFAAQPVQQQVSQERPEAMPTEQRIASGLKLGVSPIERRHREQLELQREKMGEKAKQEAFKATHAERKEIIDRARAARSDLKDLDRMEDLEKEGKLDTPGYIEFLKRTGMDVPALMNPGSEEFQKIEQSFMRNARAVFGARISNFGAQQFLRQIPTLSQSPEGRKRVIAGLKYVKRADLEQKNALQEVMKENKGIPPLDLLEQVDDKIEKRLDKLSAKFKEDLARPVPKGQNKMITALQVAAGESLGRIPKALKGAAKGAAIGAAGGSIIPGIGTGAGTLGGGAIGGLLGLFE